MIVYDIETYPNVFTCSALDEGEMKQFEISDRRNDLIAFCRWIDDLGARGEEMVGFNNLAFDYPVIHRIYQCQALGPTAEHIYGWAQQAIHAGLKVDGYIVPQIDLLKIHHFDNKARMTGLKVLEFNMRSASVEDLPFDYRLPLTQDQIDTLSVYNAHDVRETAKFLGHTEERIKFRRELSALYKRNFLNFNDTKIGKSYFVMELEKAGVECYRNGNPVQTRRKSILLKDAIFPWIGFDHPEFQRVLSELKALEIFETRGAVEGISATIRGFQFDFGLGGIHGSVDSSVILSDDEYMIEDWDVASYYPNLVIANNLYPEHLGEKFGEVYKELYERRKAHPKKKFPEINGMLKLALNGVFGDSNSEFSPFYDPLLTMKITLNGQLLLCLLAEKLMCNKHVQMIQANTDGLTIRYPRRLKEWVHSVCQWWQELTRLELENAEYSRMFIRDVNHYIAEYVNGDVKRKGAYQYELDWHQNHSALVVQKAAEAYLLRGTPIEQFVRNHDDVYDFFLRVKLPKTMRLEWNGREQQRICRYYVSTGGHPLEKIMPALGPIGTYVPKRGVPPHIRRQVTAEIEPGAWDARIHTASKSVYDIRRQSIHSGYRVQICNRVDETATYTDIDYGFYCREAEKLVNVFENFTNSP